MLLITTAALALAASSTLAQSNKKVLLQDVQVLTLSKGKMTTGRRSSPVKQMTCVGGDACSATIDTIQCYNRGFDGRDVQWECKAELEDLYRFGKTDVSCEGYANKNDKYILAGSCGVEYTLYLTEKGKHFKKNQNSYSSYDRYSSYESDYDGPERTSIVTKLIWMAVASIFLYSMYTSCIQAAATGRGNTGRTTGGSGGRGTGGGGSGGGSGGFGGGPGFGGGSGGGDSCDPPLNSRPQQQQGPGFWSGLGLGGLLGSMLNRPRGNTYAYNSYGGGWNSGFGGAGMRSRPTYTSSSSSSSSAGPSTRTASGYGGTNRR